MKPHICDLSLLVLCWLCLLTLARSGPITPSVSRRHLDTSAIDVTRVLNVLQSSRPAKLEPRSITAFVTDPALLVTILHSLEIAYWTLPFGFILTPIINLFRMPNRRMDSRSSDDNVHARQFYQTLAKAIEKIEKLNGRKSKAKSSSKQ